jgi:3-dehydroquinate synthetase
VAHAVETVAGYGVYSHGEAVALGMIAEGRLAVVCGRMQRGDQDRVERLLLALGLPCRLHEPLAVDRLILAARGDKKARSGELRCVLACALGSVETVTVDERQLASALAEIEP